MGWPKLASFFFVFCCVFPLLDFPHANAETPFLLTKLDHKQFLNNGDHEHFVGKWFQVEDYKGQDQCDATPDNQNIGSFGIFFQIDPNGFNGGHGMTFCFPGQLDPLNKILGLSFARLYQVPNVEGNEVAKMCIKAQCKGEEHCPEYENGPWHGFNLRQKENSRDMEVRLSTTNRSFIIPHKAIQSGQFFLKLTKHNSIITNFSTEIGPGYNPYNGRPHSPSVENKGQISVKLDQILRDAYLANVGKGAFLKEHMGLWALAADILPHIENNILNFFVIRSECSDMDASFIFPWDAHFTPTSKKFPAIPSKYLNREIYLERSKITYIRGRVNANAGQFSIQLIKLQIDGNELKGIRMMVQFDKNGKGMGRIQACNVVEVEHCFGEGKNWVDVADEFIEFHRNVDFILKIHKFDDLLNVSLNCQKFKPYKIGPKQLVFNERYQYILVGDVEIYDLPLGATKQVTESNFALSSMLNAKMGEGILIRAKMAENANYIRVVFYKNETVEGTNLNVSMHDLEFIAKADDISLSVLVANSVTKKMEKNCSLDDLELKNFHLDDIFFELELHIQLEPKNAILMLNNQQICNLSLDHDPEIDMVKTSIDVNADKVEGFLNVTTLEIPFLMKAQLNTDEKMQIKGKVHSGAKNFDIVMFAMDNAEAYVIGDCQKGTNCELIFSIQANFQTGMMTFSDFSNGVGNTTIVSSPFKVQEDFIVEIVAKGEQEIIFAEKKSGYAYESFKLHRILRKIDHLEIHGGIWLFGKPQIVKAERD